MLTISSIGVGPRPQQTPVVSPPPVGSGRVGAAVGKDSGGPAVAVPAGDGTGVQRASLPSTLPPVTGPGETPDANLPGSAQVVAPRPEDARTRFKGELPPEPKGPVDEALDQQIEQLIPNLWKASRAAVDALKRAEDSAEAGRAAAGSETQLPKEGAYVGADAGKPPATPGSLLSVEA